MFQCRHSTLRRMARTKMTNQVFHVSEVSVPAVSDPEGVKAPVAFSWH